LVVDATNADSRSTQIVSAYLDVEDSMVDLQPFLTIDKTDLCGGEGGESPSRFDPVFYLRNFGWGGVEAATLAYGFRNKTNPPTGAFTIPVEAFDQRTRISVQNDLKALGLQIDKVTKEKFPCDSDDHADQCAAELAKTGIFGELDKSIFTDWHTVETTASGTIDYRWTDSRGAGHSRQSPFWVDIPILAFNYEGPECGGAGPVERGYKTVKLSLDRKNYRIPLSYKGSLGPHQNRRFALSLVSEKSSQHSFKVVLELADGSNVASPKVDLLYFVPRFSFTN
jgi:hypothetical protein